VPVVALALALELVPAHALAERTECDPEDPTACSTPVNKGQVAPYSGQLLTPTLAIRLGQTAEHCDDRIELEVSHTSSIARVRLDYERALRVADVRQLTRERDAFERDRDFWKTETARRVEPPHWTSSPYFVVPLTVLATVGAVWVGIEVVKAAEARF
jgi:hypothetical protein